MLHEKNEKQNEQDKKVGDVASFLKELWERRFFLKKEVEQNESQQITDLVKKAEKQPNKTITVIRDLDEVKEQVPGGPIHSEVYSIRSLDGGKRCVLQFIDRHNGIIDGSDKGTTYMMAKKGRIWEQESVRMDEAGLKSFKPIDKVNAHPQQKTPAQIIEELRKGQVKGIQTESVNTIGTELVVGISERVLPQSSQTEIELYDKELHDLLKKQECEGIEKTDNNGDELTFDVSYSGLGFVMQVVRINKVTKDQGKKSEYVLETTTRTRIEIQKEGDTWTLKSYPSAVAVKFKNGQEKSKSYPPAKAATVQEVIDALKSR